MLKLKNKIYLPLLVLLALSLSSCSDYWWQRGQAPSPKDLLTKANTEFATVAKEDAVKNNRDSALIKAATDVKESLNKAVSLSDEKANTEEIVNLLETSALTFTRLEGKINYTSRPAYGELSAQIFATKNAIKNKNSVKNESLTLLSARVIKFMASELALPNII